MTSGHYALGSELDEEEFHQQERDAGRYIAESRPRCPCAVSSARIWATAFSMRTGAPGHEVVRVVQVQLHK